MDDEESEPQEGELVSRAPTPRLWLHWFRSVFKDWRDRKGSLHDHLLAE